MENLAYKSLQEKCIPSVHFGTACKPIGHSLFRLTSFTLQPSLLYQKYITKMFNLRCLTNSLTATRYVGKPLPISGSTTVVKRESGANPERARRCNPAPQLCSFGCLRGERFQHLVPLLPKWEGRLKAGEVRRPACKKGEVLFGKRDSQRYEITGHPGSCTAMVWDFSLQTRTGEQYI